MRGVSQTQLMAQYVLKKLTLHDILKGKEQVREITKKIEGGKKGEDVYCSTNCSRITRTMLSASINAGMG